MLAVAEPQLLCATVSCRSLSHKGSIAANILLLLLVSIPIIAFAHPLVLLLHLDLLPLVELTITIVVSIIIAISLQLPNYSTVFTIGINNDMQYKALSIFR